MKGPKGTTVDICIRRPGVDELIQLTVERDEIQIPTVRTAFMMAPGTGYVRLQDFSETTRRELDAALAKLKRGGMKQLLLDLRDNPGGPLDQAIAVSSRFLERGQMVVYTRGRIPNSDDDYRALSGRLPRAAACRPRQSPERQRLGNRFGRNSGPRPRSRRRRDDVRQGARAVGLSASATTRGWRSRPGATTRRAAGSSSDPGTAASMNT